MSVGLLSSSQVHAPAHQTRYSSSGWARRAACADTPRLRLPKHYAKNSAVYGGQRITLADMAQVDNHPHRASARAHSLHCIRFTWRFWRHLLTGAALRPPMPMAYRNACADCHACWRRHPENAMKRAGAAARRIDESTMRRERTHGGHRDGHMQVDSMGRPPPDR